MQYLIREYRRDDPEDARKLADMWNESDKAWPGGFTHGVPLSAEHIQQWIGNASRLAIFVVEFGGQIVGYGDLYAQKGQKEVAYINLLSVSPAHQGKGLGRDLILTILRRTVGLGYKQLTLHTWPGNLQAVPLYKKTGFFWKPDTSVYMQNFIPTILTLPIAQEFFARHDWYRTFRRDLSVQPDDQRWKGVPVYIYEWEADNETLRVVVDREAEAVTALESNRLAVSCSTGCERLAAGLRGTARWEIENRQSQPVTVGIIAQGEEGILLEVQEGAVVQEHLTLEREYRLHPQARPSDANRPASKIRSTLLVDGMPIELGSGVRILPAVDILFNGCGLYCGKPERVTVNLRSYLPFSIRGRVLVEQFPGLITGTPQMPFEIEAESWSAVTMVVTPYESGVLTPRLQVVLEEALDEQKAREVGFEAPLRCRPKQIALRVLDTGKVLGSILPESNEAVLENTTLTVSISLQGGTLRVRHRLLDTEVMWQEPGSLGPPFEEWQQVPRNFSARLKESAGASTLVIEMPTADDPQLILEKWITLTASSVVQVQWRVVNSGEKPFSGKLRVTTGVPRNRWIAIPLKEGILHEPVEGWGEFPLGYADLPLSESEYSEQWIAWEEDGRAVGVIWEECHEQEINPQQMCHDFIVPDVPPQGSFFLPAMYLLPEAGNWRDVRRWWVRLAEPEDEVPSSPPVVSLTEVRLEPVPLLLLEDEVQVSLSVYHRRLKSLTGTLRLQSPLAAFRKAQFVLENVNLKHPFHEQIQMVSMLAGNDAFAVQAVLDTETTSREFSLPVLKAGDLRCAFSVQQDGEMYVVDNGRMRLQVAPHFGGSLVSLEADGVNHLFSAYPEPRPFLWFNPWFGGVHPVCEELWSRILEDALFTAEPFEVYGERGFPWKGVRVATKPRHRDWRWLRLECEYLTLPGSNLLALRLRVRNLTTAERRASFGVAVWCQPSGQREEAVALYERGGQEAARRRSDYSVDIRSGRWAAVQHGQTGATLLLVQPSAEGYVEVMDCGRQGPHLTAMENWRMQAYECKEMLVWLVLTRSGERLKVYREALGALEKLP